MLPAAQQAGVGVIARVPLASGLLSGRYDEHTTFATDDRRSYDVGVRVARELAGRTPRGGTTRAARAVLGRGPARGQNGHPGARSAEQARSNAAAARLAPLAEDLLGDLAQLYDRDVREHVHSRW